MPKKYLVGVGTVRAFEGNNLIFVGKTLIESSMEISVSSTDIRGGLSNALLGQYFHDSALSLTITDAQFNLPMIAKNVGTSSKLNQLRLMVRTAQSQALQLPLMVQKPMFIQNMMGSLTALL